MLIIYMKSSMGGTTCLLGLDKGICLSGRFKEDIETPFSRGTDVGGSIGDLTTIFIRESAFQLEAALNSSISDSEVLLRKAFSRETKMNELKATTRIR